MAKKSKSVPVDNLAFLSEQNREPERPRMVVFASDFHVPHHDKTLFAGWRQFLKDTCPDEVILGGDVLDLGSMSGHGDADQHLLMDELAAGNDFLDEVDSAAPAAQKTFLHGNHCDRVDRFLAERAPSLKGIVDLTERLRLTERGYSVHKYGEVVFRGSLGFTHGFYCGEGHAAVHARRFGANLVYGHTHRPQTYTTGIAGDKVRGAFGQGCMCPTKNVPYIKGRPSGWCQSFFVAYIEPNGDFYPYTVMANDSHFVWAGKRY